MISPRLFIILIWPVIFLLALKWWHIPATSSEKLLAGLMLIVVAAFAIKVFEAAPIAAP